MTYGCYFKRYLRLIESRLHKILRGCQARPVSIHRAMQYAVFTGGKRFRPILTLAACQACGGRPREALLPACAVELIHTYSLAHDDLPALDDDDTRRGNPTCHKKFNEALAILAGDGLLTLAFEILAEVRPAAKAVRLVTEISTAAGVRGMIGGQVEDIETALMRPSRAAHDFICRNKTGKLIRASVLAGAIMAGASSSQMRSMARYGEAIGLAFQAVDDLVDRDGFCRVMPEAKVARMSRRLIGAAKREAQKIGSRAVELVYLTDFLESRIPV